MPSKRNDEGKSGRLPPQIRILGCDKGAIQKHIISSRKMRGESLGLLTARMQQPPLPSTLNTFSTKDQNHTLPLIVRENDLSTLPSISAPCKPKLHIFTSFGMLTAAFAFSFVLVVSWEGELQSCSQLSQLIYVPFNRSI